jgi:hypothetical protein
MFSNPFMVIQATAPGSQQVNGIYRRHWENETGTEDIFRDFLLFSGFLIDCSQC